MKKEKTGLFQLAWPIFMNNILGTLLGFIDVMVLSRVNDLAASSSSAVCSATSILLPQYLGKEEKEKVTMFSVLCICLNVFLGISVFIIVFFGHDTFLHLLGAKGELFEMASVYIRISVWGIVLDVYNSTIGCILYSHRKTKTSMYISSVTGILNLILDILLVLGIGIFPAMGVAGAAIATIIAKVVAAVSLSFVFFGKIESIKSIHMLAEAKKRDIILIFKLGIPSIFDSMNYSITQLVVTGIIFHFLSQNDIIARTYLMNIAVLFNLFTGALASATQILVGYKVGAGEYAEAESDCAHCMKLSLLVTGGLSIGAVFFQISFLVFLQIMQK